MSFVRRGEQEEKALLQMITSDAINFSDVGMCRIWTCATTTKNGTAQNGWKRKLS
jgi:hypothetical protein